MTPRHVLCIALVGGVLAGRDAPAAAEPRRRLVVVVARKAKVANLSRSDLKRAFTGQPVIAADVKLVPFNYAPKTAERTAFDRAILGMTPDESGRYWVDRKVRGEGSAPRALPSPLHVAKVVANFPGAIGYLPADKVTADLQVVTIDGIGPADPRYPLVIGAAP